MAKSPPPPAPPKKNASVRLSVIRGGLRGLTAMSPAVASRAAGTLFRLAPRHRTSAEEQRSLSSAKHATLTTSEGDSISTWAWGEGPRVLFVHGWGSRGARVSPFLASLLDAGFSVIAFDAPGHGASAGRLSSAPQFVRAIEAVARRYGPFYGAIAHSMGGCATALAMRRGVAVERAVFLAPAANPGNYTRQFADVLGLPDHVIDRMKRRFERQFGFQWDAFDVPPAVTGFRTPLLVFHDRDDREVLWTDGDAIAKAWPGARLVTTTGLGHTRIVSDPQVIASSLEFLVAQPAAATAGT